jgi:hypothetical protein
MFNDATDDPLNRSLMLALHFDSHDLALNRTYALLSTRQRKHIAFEIYGFLACVMIGLGGVGCFFFVAMSHLGPLILASVFIIGLISFAFGGYRLWLNRRAFNQPILFSVRGPVELSIDRSGRETLYHIGVANERFPVTSEVFAAFQEGNNYRLYFIPPCRLISAEHDPFRKPLPQ